MRFFGNFILILTTVFDGKLEGDRHNWMADIKEWTSQPAYACTSQAADRDLWSVIARQPSKRRWHSQIPDTRDTYIYILQRNNIPTNAD